MKCQKCKEKLKEGNIFCTSCGHRQLPSLPKGYLMGYFIMLILYGVFTVFCISDMRFGFVGYNPPSYYGAPINFFVACIFLITSSLLRFIIFSMVNIMRTKTTMLYTCIAAIINMFISIFYLAVVAYNLLAPNIDGGLMLRYGDTLLPYIQFGIFAGLFVALELFIHTSIAFFKNNYVIQIIIAIIYSVVLFLWSFLRNNHYLKLYIDFPEVSIAPYRNFIVYTLLFAASSISGIFVGNMLRRKYSTIYYIG